MRGEKGNMKGIGIGESDFKMLRMKDYYFIDKSLFIKDIIDNSSKVTLITRPRRFGKTLNMSMLRYFLDCTKKDSKELFEGLKIMEQGEKYTSKLGAYPCILNKNSNTYRLYKSTEISERHRHRYEFNNDYREQVEKAGMSIIGTSPDNMLVEMIEIKDHPYFVASQFHPEFKSRPDRPAPLFVGLIKAAKEYRKK